MLIRAVSNGFSESSLTACLGEELDDLSDFSSSGLISLTVFSIYGFTDMACDPRVLLCLRGRISQGCSCVEQCSGGLQNSPFEMDLLQQSRGSEVSRDPHVRRDSGFTRAVAERDRVPLRKASGAKSIRLRRDLAQRPNTKKGE